jgi:hypothetical protein
MQQQQQQQQRNNNRVLNIAVLGDGTCTYTADVMKKSLPWSRSLCLLVVFRTNELLFLKMNRFLPPSHLSPATFPPPTIVLSMSQYFNYLF